MSTIAGRHRVLLGADEIERIIARLAYQIVEPADAQQGVYLLGIRRGGEMLAQRLAQQIETTGNAAPLVGFLNINLYRDDDLSRALPDSAIPGDVNDKLIVLVDDVLYTGRTIRSALDAVTDLGRPSAIRLCVLVDRGLRELPVQADYVGRFIPSARSERISVSLQRSASPTDEVSIHASQT